MVRMILIFGLMLLSGCNMLSGPTDGKTPNGPDVKPDPAVVFSEQDYWNQLAKNVEADVFENSDDLCSAVDKLKKTGELKDVSRITEIRRVRVQPIDGVAKNQIVDTLKGK